MTSSRVNSLIVGGFVLILLGGIIAAATILAGKTGSTDTYFTSYDNVTGIKYGTQVLYEGYRIGQVDEIIPEQRAEGTSFRLRLAVQKGWRIPEGSQTTIATSGLLSAVAINIRGGTAEASLTPGSEIPGGASGGMFAAINDLASEVGTLSRDGLEPLVAKLNAYVDTLGGSLADNLPAILGNARITSEAIARDLPPIIARVDRFTARLDAEVLSQKNIDGLGASIGNISAFSAELNGLGRELRQTGQTLDGMVAGSAPLVDSSLRDLRYTLRALASSIDAITFNMEGASRDMKEFSRSLRQNPGVLLRGSAPAEDGR
ncbi:MlaD family protein [Rhodospirillum rubrum]|uniref:Mammalian cell entry related n=1 Tax=Rhodospirillum rubrum (strain ATCC 11170 / ATH 1.1.1 / DSM 467 / LMG 4362 / NCIMB 8255 / S1) TaxID=269796 RepID=Q2RQ88_RHORT|nr:MlaD family protein [Rhodospirillum rubrum]ABC23707.1 Mammalian cell entry related [Rhodospirillum rubrum ATCC 11170]AEO49446.1 hypothetical protein F11_14920 [Rhodospirillum rubrum F11]MBK5955384.1 hypothetical protein [Rhodospirillum rubrum]QXG79663.1 MCE family protein [Rhodospirillum rubrum]HAQ00701.1 MCE family protein [Rhodospirillum rubrum]